MVLFVVAGLGAAYVDLSRPPLAPWQRENYERAMHAAPTLLEVMFWGFLLQLPGAERVWLEELIITPLEGPGGVPDDFAGDGPSPDW